MNKLHGFLAVLCIMQCLNGANKIFNTGTITITNTTNDLISIAVSRSTCDNYWDANDKEFTKKYKTVRNVCYKSGQFRKETKTFNISWWSVESWSGKPFDVYAWDTNTATLRVKREVQLNTNLYYPQDFTKIEPNK